jgi:hypothetical protein
VLLKIRFLRVPQLAQVDHACLVGNEFEAAQVKDLPIRPHLKANPSGLLAHVGKKCVALRVVIQMPGVGPRTRPAVAFVGQAVVEISTCVTWPTPANARHTFADPS